jgi:hypothetical protein
MDHLITDHPSRTTPDFSAHEARQRLEHRITELAAHIAAATYELLVLIGQYDKEKGWVQHGMASCANWLQWRCGTNPGAARENESCFLNIARYGTARQLSRSAPCARSAEPFGRKRPPTRSTRTAAGC